MQVTARGPQTAADWTALNPVLDQFEIGIEVNPATGKYERQKMGDGRTAWNDLNYLDSGGVKVYRALLTQTSTDAPVATVLENTLGGTVVWTRDNIGMYLGTLAGAFTENKTIIPPGGISKADTDLSAQKQFTFTRDSSDVISLRTGISGTLEDDCLVALSVEILVYP